VIFSAIDLVSIPRAVRCGNADDLFQDALLASRILVSLLRQEDIPYTLIPIGGYSELEARKNQIFGIDPEADEEEQVVSRDCEVCIVFLSLGMMLTLLNDRCIPLYWSRLDPYSQ
jgi:hypothetical protein